MGPIRSPETSVRNYHYSLRNNPDERRSFRTQKQSIYNTLEYVATPCNRLRKPRTLTTSQMGLKNMMGASLFPEAVTRKLLQYYQIRQKTDSSVLTRCFCSFGRTVFGTQVR